MDAEKALRGGAGGTVRAAEREQSATDTGRALRGGVTTVRAARKEQSATDAIRALRGGTETVPAAGCEQSATDAGRALRGGTVGKPRNNRFDGRADTNARNLGTESDKRAEIQHS